VARDVLRGALLRGLPERRPPGLREVGRGNGLCRAPRAHAQRDARGDRRANTINDVPVVIDFRTDASEKVFPMVAAGASNDDIIVHPLQRGSSMSPPEPYLGEVSRTPVRHQSSPCSSRTRPGCWRESPGCSLVAASTSTHWRSRRPRVTPGSLASRSSSTPNRRPSNRSSAVGQNWSTSWRSATSRHATPWSANCCSRRCPWTTGIVRHARHDHQSRRVDRRRQFDVGDGDAGGDPGRVRRTRTGLEDFAEVELHRTGRVALPRLG